METKIQELRKANKISQAELADEMGVTRQTIISLEKGRYNASLELASAAEWRRFPTRMTQADRMAHESVQATLDKHAAGCRYT